MVPSSAAATGTGFLPSLQGRGFTVLLQDAQALFPSAQGKEGLGRHGSFPLRAASAAAQLPAAGVRAAAKGLWVPAALCLPAVRKVHSPPAARCQASAVS